MVIDSQLLFWGPNLGVRWSQKCRRIIIIMATKTSATLGWSKYQYHKAEQVFLVISQYLPSVFVSFRELGATSNTREAGCFVFRNGVRGGGSCHTSPPVLPSPLLLKEKLVDCSTSAYKTSHTSFPWRQFASSRGWRRSGSTPRSCAGRGRA